MFRLSSSLKTTRLVSRSLVVPKSTFVPPHTTLKPVARVPVALSIAARRYISMDAQELRSYLADAPPSVVRLEIAKHFDALTDKQKRYAHWISK